MNPKTSFETMLTGGHPNSLGNTIEVVELVFKNQELLSELYACYRSADPVVRLRTSNAFKRVWHEHPTWVVPYISRFLDEVSVLDQASAEWTTATLIRELHKYLTAAQSEKSVQVLKRFLTQSNDWIVLNETLKSLEPLAKKDADLAAWMLPHLEKLCQDPRKSVSKKAAKQLANLSK